MTNRTAIILGASSDIGTALAERLRNDDWAVIGQYRPVFDLTPGGIARFVESLAGLKWDLFISAVGTVGPVGPFFDTDFDAWQDSINVNFTAQLRALHALWPKRGENPAVMFFAGGGTNGPFRNYSAYCVAKIALIKMCELLDDEDGAACEADAAYRLTTLALELGAGPVYRPQQPHARASFFAIGPGYVRTKIHDETLRAGAAAGDNLSKTRALLQGPGTSMDDIYSHLKWCLKHRDAASGRNFSTVHDPWRDPDWVSQGPNAYRLRRRPG